MRILAGEDSNFEGRLDLVPGVKVGYLPQEPALDDACTVLQNIEPAVQPVKDMLQEYESVRNMLHGCNAPAPIWDHPFVSGACSAGLSLHSMRYDLGQTSCSCRQSLL